MIISVSRRTDVPALYMDWFLKRLDAGEVFVRNPMRYDQVRRVGLARADVDGFVFWSKYPGPLLKSLDRLREYPFYILYTLNSYGKDIERGLPEEGERLDVFRGLAEALGAGRVVWRYDPVLLSDGYTEAFHLENFERLAGLLSGFAGECVTSFVSPYAKIKRALAAVGAVMPSVDVKRRIAGRMGEIARGCEIELFACCDPDLSDVGLLSAACVDAGRMERISGVRVRARRDSGQRLGCSCCASVDIGVYDTCVHGCVYCYANRSVVRAERNFREHDSGSVILSGFV